MNDNETSQQGDAPQAANDAPEEPNEKTFQQQEFLVLIGIRQAGPDDRRSFTKDIIIDSVADVHAMLPGPKGQLVPNTAVPAVSFGQWLDRNWSALLHMWEAEYALSMGRLESNQRARELQAQVEELRARLKEAEPGKPPELHLVAPDGSRLN